MTQRETGILFKPDMIQAILDGKKTQTRRKITIDRKCRFGECRDLLYIKEPHFLHGRYVFAPNGESRFERSVEFVGDNGSQKRLAPACTWRNPPPHVMPDQISPHRGWYRRNPLFAPKSEAKIWLEITSIQDEKIQEIRHGDALAEGVNSVAEFRTLWDSINAKKEQSGYIWEDNPRVWVIEFKIISTKGR